MPKTPKGDKRPADVVSNAVLVMRLATGETLETEGKNPAAVALGALGGKARAKNLSKTKRRKIAKMGGEARWNP